MLPAQQHKAFCAICPEAEQVSTLLCELGFHLVFQLAAYTYPAYTPTPDLPAQFHYLDRHGTEVMFLAGQDAGLAGEHLPVHASRFWITSGRDLLVFQSTALVLAANFSLTWQSALNISPTSCNDAA